MPLEGQNWGSARRKMLIGYLKRLIYLFYMYLAIGVALVVDIGVQKNACFEVVYELRPPMKRPVVTGAAQGMEAPNLVLLHSLELSL